MDEPYLSHVNHWGYNPCTKWDMDDLGTSRSHDLQRGIFIGPESMPVDSLKPRGELPKAHAGFTPRV